MFRHPDPLDAAAPDACADRLCEQGHVRLTPAALAALAHQPLDALLALGPHWRDLPPDAHLKDGGRYRRRRHGSYVQDTAAGTLVAVPHRAHWQPTTYNALHGGMLRWFDPLQPALAVAPALLDVMARLGDVFAQAARQLPPVAGEPVFDGRWSIEAHAFRIDTTGGVGRPTPEGAHRDGVAFVAVLLVDRQGVIGGETRVFEADGPRGVRFTLDQPWSALLLDDARVIHETTPIQPAEPGGWRDTLVLTYRAGGFQDPPAA
ncbi:2OG-Fe dioxygenase family protein [Leptothrix discophora]|uniref:2OG-Fe dioxygenase family protein n=2 Tax=Leptothrix discophora TaxID=89 RepID=A0ABT9FZL1_LEPDI|nr:2OG-Fe dioxygenase family protein [Leptothrix discophora]MDP4299664.1 2OG-Fe dioxygenase family protein [Leptothrix discophora]